MTSNDRTFFREVIIRSGLHPEAKQCTEVLMKITLIRNPPFTFSPEICEKEFISAQCDVFI